MSDPKIDALKQQAETAVEEAKNRGGTGLVFAPEGITKFRLAFDPENRLCRSVNRYRIGDVTIPQMEDMTEIEGLLKELTEAGCGSAWKMGNQETIISYAYILEAQQQNDYMKLKEWCVFGYDYKVYNGIMARINEWDADVVAAMMNPTQVMNMWSLDRKGGKGGSAAVGADLNQIAVPALPADAKPLSQCWIAEGTVATAEDYAKAVTYLKNELLKYSKTSEPVSGAAFSPDAPAPTATVAPQVAPVAAAPVAPVAVAPVAVAPVAVAPVAVAPVAAVAAPVAAVAAPVAAPVPVAAPMTATGGVSVGTPSPVAAPAAVGGEVCARAAEGRTFGQYEATPPCLMCTNSAACQIQMSSGEAARLAPPTA